jgi:hypothetical protein
MLRFAAALAVLPLATHAACPTAADLETGVVFTVNDIDTETFTRISPTVIESSYAGGDTGGEVTKSLFVKGYYWVQSISFDTDGKLLPDSRTIYAFPGSAADLPDPEPLAEHRFDVVRNDEFGIVSEVQMHIFGDFETREYGSCPFIVLPSTIEYFEDGQSTGKDFMEFLPELGVALWVGSEYDGTKDEYVYKIEE